jgi:gluconolactonase
VYAGHAALLLLVVLVPLLARVSAAPPPDTSVGRIERRHPRFDGLVAPDARIETLADGFAWVEGPAWDPRGGYLLFSDIPNNRVVQLLPGGAVRDFLRPSGYTGTAAFAGREPGSNGLAFDPQGRLVLNQHGDRRIVRLEGERFVTLVDRFEGRRINSPNDLVFARDGSLYFTDPPFGLPNGAADPTRELPFAGVYRLAADGRLTLLTSEVEFPNGLGFSPDESTLYVSNADLERPVWFAYPVEAADRLGRGRTFFDASAWAQPGLGVPDGLKLDVQGNLWAAGPGGRIFVIAPDGTLLGSLSFGVPTANLSWGEDGSVLYVASNTAIRRLRTRTRGAGSKGRSRDEQ